MKPRFEASVVLFAVLLAACGGADPEPEFATPTGPLLGIAHGGAVLPFTLRGGESGIRVGVSEDLDAGSPPSWTNVSTVRLEARTAPWKAKVFAASIAAGCDAPPFVHVYEVRAAYPAPAGQEGTDAVALDDPRIAGWAAGWADPVAWGADLDAQWQDASQAVGPASGKSADIVALGNGGALTLTFDPPIADGAGPDFAVFENGFADDFLELAWVEVSSDGEHFARFGGVSLSESPVDAFGRLDTARIGGFAGRYRAGQGTPFDLADLDGDAGVLAGLVDRSAIAYVRVVDVIGDGSILDSLGNPVYDPFPVSGSAGFDLDGVAVLSAD